MPAFFLKYFFIFLCSCYFYNKILNIPFNRKYIFVDIIFSSICTIATHFIKLHIAQLNIIVIILLIFFNVLLTRKKSVNMSFTTSIISCGFSYFAFFISMFLISPIFILLISFVKNNALKQLIAVAVISIIQLLISTLPFKLKRLKNGMPFLMEKGSGVIGILISTVLLILTFFYGSGNETIFFLSIMLTAACGICLYIWWKRQLTRSYLKKIKANEINDLKKQIEELKFENENFSKLIHKDNKLIPAMEMAVNAVIDAHITGNADISNITQLRDDLHTLAQERQGILSSYEQDKVSLPATGLVRTDALIQYLYKKAALNHVNFSFKIPTNLRELRKGIVAEDSLNTLIADLCENAIIATKNASIKKVLLSINKENNTLYIDIYDTGHHFDANVIKYMGQTRYTTHGDSGGSGIGLMTTFELIRLYSASFIIDERCDNNPYCKKVSVCFDGFCKVQIHSDRTEVHNALNVRDDILLIS